jgi:hypothetical protein
MYSNIQLSYNGGCFAEEQMRRQLAFVLLGLFSIFSIASAQVQRFGSWRVDFGADQSDAYTSNDSGSVFGFFCYENSCTFYLNTGSTCKENSRIPLLINADSGSNYSIGTCVVVKSGTTTRYFNSIQDKDIVTAISSGRIIGFAIPMEGGDFKVVRFNLDGAIAASGKAAEIIDRPKTRDTGLRDRTL